MNMVTELAYNAYKIEHVPAEVSATGEAYDVATSFLFNDSDIDAALRTAQAYEESGMAPRVRIYYTQPNDIMVPVYN